MKSKKPRPVGKRRRGKSRLEKLLEDSIRYELAIKALRRELFSLSLAVARLERTAEGRAGVIPKSDAFPLGDIRRYGAISS